MQKSAPLTLGDIDFNDFLTPQIFVSENVSSAGS